MFPFANRQDAGRRLAAELLPFAAEHPLVLAYVSDATLRSVGISASEVARLVEVKKREVEARARRLRRGRPAPALRGRTVILVDDGVATGGTALAALRSARARDPTELILAVPVVAAQAIEALSREVDRLLCLAAPDRLYAVGAWYQDFDQVTEEEVVDLLDRAQRALSTASSP